MEIINNNINKIPVFKISFNPFLDKKIIYNARSLHEAQQVADENISDTHYDLCIYDNAENLLAKRVWHPEEIPEDKNDIIITNTGYYGEWEITNLI